MKMKNLFPKQVLPKTRKMVPFATWQSELGVEHEAGESKSSVIPREVTIRGT